MLDPSDPFRRGFSIALTQNPKTGKPGRNRLRVAKLTAEGYTARWSGAQTRRVKQPDGSITSEMMYDPPGNFLDLKTASFALTSELWGLERCVKEWCYADPWQGQKSDHEHGHVSAHALEYCRTDVTVSSDLAVKLYHEQALLGIRTPLHRLYSPATVTKDLLDRAGIQPLLERQPDLDRDYLGRAMESFHAGYSFLFARGVTVPILAGDIASCYPAGHAAMRLDRFDTCARIVIDHGPKATRRVRQLVKRATLDQVLEDPKLHPNLVFFALVDPRGDVLPVRAAFDQLDDTDTNVSIVRVDHGPPRWVCGPDVLAAKIAPDGEPDIHTRIIDAFTISFEGQARELQEVVLPDGTSFDPRSENLCKRLIEARKLLATREDLTTQERARSDLFLKIVANAIYGVSARDPTTTTNRPARADHHPRRPTIPSRHKPARDTRRILQPLHGLTDHGWAHLQLIALQRVIKDTGGITIYGDTDSTLILATPNGGPVTIAGECASALSYQDAIQLLHRFDPN